MGNVWATEVTSASDPDGIRDVKEDLACFPRIASVDDLPEELRPYGAVNAFYFSDFSLFAKLYSSEGSLVAATTESGLWVNWY